MQWPPEQIWEGEDVFILGGGPSVKRFPITRLKDKHVIGCNDAYLFGEDIVDILIFGDKKWWDYHHDQVAFRAFRNPVFTNHRKMRDVLGVIHAPREESGFHRCALGWNGNTGASAINLALVLGASRVFLIGFDMTSSDTGETNWHSNPLDKITEIHYERYKRQMAMSISTIYANWPEVEVINLNVDSAMDLFPKVSWDQVFSSEEVEQVQEAQHGTND